MKVLVTGGWGFLGSHMFHALQAEGHTPIRISRRIGCDLTSRASTYYYLNAIRPDAVIHCASLSGGIQFQHTAPFDIYDVNLSMIANVVHAAASLRVPKVVNVICSCAYPEMKTPMRETDLFSAPVSESAKWTALSARDSIHYCSAAVAQGPIDIRTVILPNLYGPGDHFDPDHSHALAAMMVRFYQAKRNGDERVVIWGSGSPIREWLHARDAAVGTVRYMDVDNPLPVLNIGNGIGFTITELAMEIAKTVGYEGNLIYDDSKPDGPPRKTLDIRLMRKTLEWRPSITLSGGLGETHSWLEANYDNMVDAGLI